jgi:hypothetical protein
VSRAVGDTDPMLRRVERDALFACGAMALAALAATRGLAAPLGVVGGGLLAAVSYGGIKGGIDALVAVAGPDREARRRARRRAAIGLVKFFTRYAILAAAAYVIMARLRLPPIAVLAGASSVVIAVTLEALRALRPKSPGNVQ